MSIEVRNISKTFGTFKAIDDVNLKVNEGELVALLGPSGSGKTTLLRIIAGLEAADSNPESMILFHDQDVAQRHAGQRNVGFVFQHYALFRHMTVHENVAFGLRVRPRKLRPSASEIDQRVHKLLKLVQLDGMGKRYPSQLSGGQRQRVALARALAVQPKVLLLDEPFGALDAKVRAELRQWLRKLHDEIHVTSLFVTHDQEEALEVADRVVVMNHGKIEQQGTPDQVFHQPANEFVMNFLGNVNLFHGRVEEGKVVYGPLTLESTAAGSESKSACMFVRPHELEVHKTPPSRPSLRARVLRVLSAGSTVKLELLGEQGEHLHAELPHDQFRVNRIASGDEVFVSVREGRIFSEDYMI
ncbi:MAG: sulfate/molybdate ABC transporter ATP-binding protein [Phycisphaeraceae bacterium]|nr:sulfate/molybdate ABC transporter ATP-binding protein [Phycisphaeraceae bacterium]